MILMHLLSVCSMLVFVYVLGVCSCLYNTGRFTIPQWKLRFHCIKLANGMKTSW